MHNLDGTKITRIILAINGTIFLLLGIFGLFYHYVMATSCMLMAGLLYISPMRSLTNRGKLFVYAYYMLFTSIILLFLITVGGIARTYS